MSTNRTRIGVAVGVLLGAVAACAIYVHGMSQRVFDRQHPLPEPWSAPTFAASSELEARGRHVATTIAQCQFCHGNDLGGRQIADDPLIGRIDSSNLTRGEGGVARDFSVADWERAIRFGLRSDGRSLLLMPSRHLSVISDRDLFAVITFLRTIPPIDRTPRSVRIGWLTRAAIVMGAADDVFSAGDTTPERPSTGWSPQETTPEYGRYLVEIGNCRVCHHADLQGGLHPLALPGEPPPPSLRGATAMQGWGFLDFARAMRTGQTPDGRLLDREYMPWPGFAALSELELEALWSYLSERPVETGHGSELARAE